MATRRTAVHQAREREQTRMKMRVSGDASVEKMNAISEANSDQGEVHERPRPDRLAVRCSTRQPSEPIARNTAS